MQYQERATGGAAQPRRLPGVVSGYRRTVCSNALRALLCREAFGIFRSISLRASPTVWGPLPPRFWDALRLFRPRFSPPRPSRLHSGCSPYRDTSCLHGKTTRR